MSTCIDTQTETQSQFVLLVLTQPQNIKWTNIQFAINKTTNLNKETYKLTNLHRYKHASIHISTIKQAKMQNTYKHSLTPKK